MIGHDLVEPLEKCVLQFGVVLQPHGVEVEAERCFVGFIVAFKIMVQKIVELFATQQVTARVHHGATWKIFVEAGVVSSVQFVHNDFPDGVRATGALLTVAVALVRHAIIESVWPERR